MLRFANLSPTMPGVTGRDRYNLIRFLAFQLVRGWSFRDDMSELATLMARNELAATIDQRNVRRYLKKLGRDADDVAVASFMEAAVTSPWRILPSGSMAVQTMLAVALEIMPLLWDRRIRVLMFDEPMLLTSDQPVALWARPGRDLETDPLGIATADAIWMPLDRSHSLALTQTGKEVIIRSQPSRARQINQAVAFGASRWIFQHPDEPAFDVADLPERPPWRTELVRAVAEGEELRVLYRVVQSAL